MKLLPHGKVQNFDQRLGASDGMVCSKQAYQDSRYTSTDISSLDVSLALPLVPHLRQGRHCELHRLPIDQKDQGHLLWGLPTPISGGQSG